MKLPYEEWTKENPIEWDDEEEDGMIAERHYQMYLWECMKND